MQTRIYRSFLILLANLTILVMPAHAQDAPSLLSTFETHNAVMLLIDPESGAIVDANAAASRLYGYPVETLESMSIQSINMLTPEQVAEERDLALKENRNFFIFRHRTANDAIKTVEVYSRPIDVDGRKLLFSIIHDVSDKQIVEESLYHYKARLEEMVDKQSTELGRQYDIILLLVSGGFLICLVLVLQLRSSLITAKAAQNQAESERSKLNTIIRATKSGTWERFFDPNVTMADDSYAEMLGYTAAELNPLPAYKLEQMVHPEDLPRLRQALDDCFNMRSDSYESEFRLRHRDGHWIWILDRGKIMEWTNGGKPIRMAGTHSDITDMKQAVELLDLSEQRFKDFSRSSSDWFWEMDADLRFSFLSERLEHNSGLSVQETLGKTRKEIGITDVDDEYWQDHFASLERHEEFRDFIYSNTRKDGRKYWVSVSGVPVFSATGDFAGYRGTGKNITDQVEAENRLALATAKAEAANKAKSVFLASTSHELRTPMTTVLGYCDLLLDSDIDATTKDHIDSIRSATDALLNIVNDILDMSKLEEGKMQVEMLDFDLRDLLHKVFGMFNTDRKAYSPALEWHIHISDDVPAYIKSDPTRLRQVLINLIGNARKFTSHGQISLSCYLQRQNDNATGIVIAVKDTGIGMSPAAAESIFDEFQQADATISRRYEGTGLGLTISKRIVELLGGDIQVKSDQDLGSTFWFTLPLIEGKADNKWQQKDLTAGSFTATRQLHILVAEDNAVNQVLIQKVLTNFGHQVTLVGDGLAAVQACQAQDFDLVLMDIRMPNMGGVEATREIRNLPAPKCELPIIAATADAMIDHIEGYLEAGMNACVSKPFDWPALVQTINTVLHDYVHVIKQDQ